MSFLQRKIANVTNSTYNKKCNQKMILGISEGYIQFINKKKVITEYRYLESKRNDMYNYLATQLPQEFTFRLRGHTIEAIIANGKIVV